MFVDSHAHLDGKQFDSDREQVIAMNGLMDGTRRLALALARVGDDRAQLLLATLSLALLARLPDARAVLPLIEQAERLLGYKVVQITSQDETRPG